MFPVASSSACSSPTAQYSVSESNCGKSPDGCDTGASTAVPSSPIDMARIKDMEGMDDYAMDGDSKEYMPRTKEDSSVTPEQDLQSRLISLNALLEKSSMYTAKLGEQMNMTNMTIAQEQERARSSKKRSRDDIDQDEEEDDTESKQQNLGDAPVMLKQPEAITGATLKDYQLQGVEWLTGLYLNGVNGILADEMGLGKVNNCCYFTLQTIAFLAHVPVTRPALIVCPLSVLHNWVDEFTKFAPSIPVCLYHGTPAERAELRNTKFVSFMNTSSTPVEGHTIVEERPAPKSRGRPRKSNVNPIPKKPVKKAAKKEKTAVPEPLRRSARSTRSNIRIVESESENDVSIEEGADGSPKSQAKPEKITDVTEEEPANELPNNLVVITTYEMIIKDRQHLAKYQWNFIVVDEGHRLKNMDCKLVQEIKKYDSANRLILTGTPLHNNLAELWSLLNFILPDIFTDLNSFQEWFNLPMMQNTLPTEHSSRVISKLHDILKPFLLRRLKADVEHSLPPKKEYVLYAPLSERQRAVYDAVLTGVLRSYLINGKRDSVVVADVTRGRGMRKRRKVSYKVDSDDEAWFENLESDESQMAQEDELDAAQQFNLKNSVKQVNSMKLQNTVMQLRKVCSHPFLFDWPSDPVTREPVVNDELVKASGKMMILDRLLEELFTRGHKVLLFSQFTTMLDIIEEWADTFKSWPLCRIDGSTGPSERRAEMNRFQQGGDSPDAPKLFLLSTRAGGLGITLTAADTVIFYDQDWNPQMDIQAQDRAHRIGQTKPVLIFRLVSAHTVETKIMQRANEKRQLEALVIAKGKFRMPGSKARTKNESMAEMAASLLKLEGEKIEVVPDSEAGKAKIISDADLEQLLDRSPEVFAGRGKGWNSGAKGGDQAKPDDVAFEVFQAPVDQCNDSLAVMMGETVE
ncbi:SNF2 family DNA-dependent ATPase [Hysterangium stoloniferum]|nr:SNF2 family DNA-dependent ATPase [Hysterangium stoloniferum]